jgi:hypothetical protein
MGYNSTRRDSVIDAELGDSTGSLKVVQDGDNTERSAEGFLEANRLVAKEHKLLMSAKQLRRGRLHCTLDRGTRCTITGRHGLLWRGSQLANLYPLLMQVLIIASTASPQDGMMIGMFWARAGGMMNGSELGTRP